MAALLEMNVALVAISLPSLRVWVRSKRQGIITAELNENEVRLARIGSGRSAVSRVSVVTDSHIQPADNPSFKTLTFAIRHEEQVDMR